MTTHVFIVDDTTFPLHLQYRFAGTGAREYKNMDFVAHNPSMKLKKGTPEGILVGMVADINRIRKNDHILFYVLATSKSEGQFYGIFRAADVGFLDNGDNKQFLLNDLGKSLTFRVQITPDEVYPCGVTEWRALDEIRNIEKPCQMLWSLIYRKLKGFRGCTMITRYEEERLFALIRQNQTPLNCGNKLLAFDKVTREIILRPENTPPYAGTKTPFSVIPRLLEKDNRNQQFEVHLQASITENLGQKNDPLTKILLGDAAAEWIGNEVGCGVGMQKIDVMVSFKRRHQYIMPIELKSVSVEAINVRQINRYVEWLEQYYIPNLPSIIAPVLVTRKTHGELPLAFLEAVARFNKETEGRTCEPLRLVEFEVGKNGIHYAERAISG